MKDTVYIKEQLMLECFFYNVSLKIAQKIFSRSRFTANSAQITGPKLSNSGLYGMYRKIPRKSP